MWIDATSAAGFIYNPKHSRRSPTRPASPPAPIAGDAERRGWFWAWALGIPTSSKKVDAAKKFLKWATSKDYVKLVGENEGWVAAPPGTRKSTYDNPEYQKAAPFAKFVLKADRSRPTRPTRRKNPVPYTGIQFVGIPEFQAHRHAGRPGDRGGACRPDDGRPGAGDGAGRRPSATMKQAGYIQVSRQLGRGPARRPGPGGRPVSQLERRPDGEHARPAQRPRGRRPRRLAARRSGRDGAARCRCMAPVGRSLLLIWMIVPLVMTLWFSFQRYNLLNPTITRLRRLRELQLPRSPTRRSGTAIVNTLYLVGCGAGRSRSASAPLLAILFDQRVLRAAASRACWSSRRSS